MSDATAAKQPVPITPRTKAEVVAVTPETAREWLVRNTHNRKISQANVDKLTAAIRRGEWKLNGEAIKIASDGTILDGQHRLLAIVESETAIDTFVITGLPADTQETMDTGKQRSLADVLSLRGEKSCTQLASVLTAVLRAERYGLRAAFVTGYVVTNAQATARLDAEPSFRDVVREVRSLGSLGLGARVAGTLYYRFSLIDASDADFFFSRLSTGEELERNSPILILRQTLLRLRAEMRGRRNDVYTAAITIKAWNKFRDGEEVGLLRFTPGGATPERFPEPK